MPTVDSISVWAKTPRDQRRRKVVTDGRGPGINWMPPTRSKTACVASTATNIGPR